MGLLTLKVEEKVKELGSTGRSLLEIICADKATAEFVRKNLETLFGSSQCNIRLLNVERPAYSKYQSPVEQEEFSEFSELEEDLF